MVKLSVLDLAPIVEGGDAGDSLRNAAELAQTAERLGYTRYWLAEHHGLPSVASSAPEILIEHVASATPRQRSLHALQDALMTEELPLTLIEAAQLVDCNTPERWHEVGG